MAGLMVQDPGRAVVQLEQRMDQLSREIVTLFDLVSRLTHVVQHEIRDSLQATLDAVRKTDN